MNQSRVEPNKRTYFEIFIKTCYTCWTRDFECLCWMSEDLDTKVKKALSWSCTEELENNFTVNQVFTMAKGLTRQGYSYVIDFHWDLILLLVHGLFILQRIIFCGYTWG